jgi:hypothetical protein
LDIGGKIMKKYLLLGLLSILSVPFQIAPLIGQALVTGGLSGLSEYFGAKAQQKSEKEQREYEQRERERQREEETKRRERARGFIGGESAYGYTPYGQTYQPFQATAYRPGLQSQTQATLAQFLGGQLTPAQQGILAQERQLGEEQIARTAAQRGMPAGGQLALSTQLARDIALKGAELGGTQQQIGLQYALPYEQFEAEQFYRPQEIEREERRTAFEYGLADYLRQQEAEQRRRELLAQYA